MRAWKMVIGIVVSMPLVALAACTTGAREKAAEQAITDPRFGVWVYQMDNVLADAASQDAFLELTRCYGIKSVYLSTGGLVWTGGHHAELPAFLSRLYNNAVRADALLSGTVYGDIDGALQAVFDYNDSQDDAHGFQGVHLDLEPWQNTGSDVSWLDPLIATYQRVATEAAPHGLPLVADVSGSKMVSSAVTTQQRQSMLDAVVRLVLMQYEVNDLAPVIDRTQRFMTGVTSSPSHSIVVGVRAIDFAAPVKTQLDALDAQLGGQSYYRGWAVFNYAAASAPEQTSSLPNCNL
jgi:hypothetical protein